MIVDILREIVRQRRAQLILVGTLIILSVATCLVRLTLLQQKLVTVRQEWSEHRAQASRRATLSKVEQYDAGMRDFARFASRIPSRTEFARVIGNLFEFAENNSLIVGSVTYRPEKSMHGYTVYKISIDVTGTYGGIKSFLGDVGQAREVMAVESVGLGKGGAVGEENVKLQAVLTVLFGAGGA